MKITGSVTLNLVGEERAFWINAFKKVKPKTELEKRILKRTLMRLMRKNTHRFPLYPDKECPICERIFAHKVFDRHYFVCKKRRQEPQFEVDPEILERLKFD